LSRLDRGTDAKLGRGRKRARSASRRTAIRRLRAGRSRRTVAFLTLLFAVGLAGVALAGPGGTILGHDPASGDGLAKAGPVNPSTGFPDWYRDKAQPNSVALEPCLEPKNPMCVIGDVPNPDAPLTLKSTDPAQNNFPDEFFYFLADSQMGAVGDPNAPGAGGAGKARLTLALEGAFATKVVPGDQMVFARLRVRVTDGLKGNSDYKVIQPYGTTTVHTDAGDPTLFVTEDVGITPGAFNDAVSGRIGPFLKWTNDGSAADQLPRGYIGDPTVEHTVTGSPTGHNMFRIEGPGIGVSAPAENKCTDLPTEQQNDCVQTDLFTLMGKTATRSGVTVERSTYSRTKAGDATMDVLAEANAQQNIVVQDSDAARRTTPGRQFPTTQMEEGDTDYYAHVDLPSATAAPDAVPADVEIANASDNPVTRKNALITDAVTATAAYDASAGNLHIEARSTDNYVNGTTPAATLSYAGDALTPDTSGAEVLWTADKALTAPPATVKITSDRGPDGKGGSIEVPVTVTGRFSPVAALRASAGIDAVARPGAQVKLDGTGSTGNIESYAWTGPYKVNPADGTLGALIDPSPVTLAGADTPEATFTAPTDAGTLGFRLEVTGAQAGGGRDQLTDDVVVDVQTPASTTEQLTVARARFTAAQARWVVDGTSITDPVATDNEIVVHNGPSATGPVIGSAVVDRLGNWAVDVRGSDLIPDTSTNPPQVTVVSSFGNTQTFDVEVRGTPVATAAAAVAGAAAPGPLAAAVPLAGARVATVGAAGLAAPTAVTAAAFSTGVPVTVNVPAGATLVRLRVLTTAGTSLFSTFKKVKGGTKARISIRSAKLRRAVRAGRRYVLEVRAGTAKTRLGKATRKTLRVR
jgi:hypothetical protein